MVNDGIFAGEPLRKSANAFEALKFLKLKSHHSAHWTSLSIILSTENNIGA